MSSTWNSHPLLFQLLPKHSAAINLSCSHLELPSSVVSAVAETQCSHHPGSGAEEEGQRQEGERTGETGTGECA